MVGAPPDGASRLRGVPGLTDEVRAHAAAVAAAARHVRIDEAALDALAARAGEVPEPEHHQLPDGAPEDVALHLLELDAINFGSGWFPTLRKRVDPATGRAVSGARTVAWALADRFRLHGPWTAAELRALTTPEVADALGQPRDHELLALYAQALRDLGRWLGDRGALDVVAGAGGSAERLATQLAQGMALFDDRGFFKRAQITAHDLAISGLAEFDDLDRLTIFADNLVPHVLRCDGVLVYDDALAARIDAGELLPLGGPETEVRACAVHACELLSERTGIPARKLDVWLWNRGQAPEVKARPRHRTRCVFY
jgi:hypothetical protein